MSGAVTQADELITRIRAELAEGEPQPWVEHSGGGRPNKPSDYVEVEMRGGLSLKADSACFMWPWADPEDAQGYEDDPVPAHDVMRWRPAKRPLSDKQLAAYVPDLLDAFAKAIAEERERASRLLTDYAAVLRTKEGRRKAEWAEQDAEMVANELDRQATAIRASGREGGQ